MAVGLNKLPRAQEDPAGVAALALPGETLALRAHGGAGSKVLELRLGALQSAREYSASSGFPIAYVLCPICVMRTLQAAQKRS